MKGDWAKIMNLVHGVRKISDTYCRGVTSHAKPGQGVGGRLLKNDSFDS
jgi:hypothetical protein